MRTAFDFSPLYRSSIGFDRIFGLLENASRTPGTDNWPPYDIAKTGEDTYRITMAVAGFARQDLNILHERNLLVICGEKTPEEQGDYLHHGIAERPFMRRFELADHVKVVKANLINGLLTIDFQREIPEEMKPRRIEIASGNGMRGSQIDSKATKASRKQVTERSASSKDIPAAASTSAG